jgi:RimJ/RimL family protein N-acetyltransferase
MDADPQAYDGSHIQTDPSFPGSRLPGVRRPLERRLRRLSYRRALRSPFTTKAEAAIGGLRVVTVAGVLYQGITGPRREYRGRGLARALKLRTIEYARAQGKREIRTWNDTLNAPMLAINVKLGFVRQPAWITFEKILEPDNGGS